MGVASALSGLPAISCLVAGTRRACGRQASSLPARRRPPEGIHICSVEEKPETPYDS